MFRDEVSIINIRSMGGFQYIVIFEITEDINRVILDKEDWWSGWF